MVQIFEFFLEKPIANGLVFFYKFFGNNLGWAVVFFTIFLKIILIPLTKPYMESVRKMRELTPLIARLKKRYGNDKVGFTKAQAELYRQKGVNPGAGCLPYLLQFLILIAFFRVFTIIISPQDSAVERFNKLLYQPLKFSENDVINTKFLYWDVRLPDTLNLFGFKFPGFLVILASLAQFIMIKISNPYIEAEGKLAGKTKQKEDDIQVAMQKTMVYTLPLITLFFGSNFASGLVIYWLLFSSLQILQQVKEGGWGELTPLIKKLKVVKL